MPEEFNDVARVAVSSRLVPAFNRSSCANCGNPLPLRRIGMLTCSGLCHSVFVERLVLQFGEYKRVMDLETGVTHRVPTRDILERGLKHTDLHKYPLWSKKE